MRPFVPLYLWAVVALSASIACVFLVAFARRKRAASLVVAWLALSPGLWFLREAQAVPVRALWLPMAAMGPMLFLGLLIVLNSERQR